MSASHHLLIVDDDKEICALLSRFLIEHGFRVSAAGDGKAATGILEAARIDLIILDIMLPGEDGLSICRRLRIETMVPIIMLTAKGDEIDRIVGMEMGADDYLPKNTSPRELLVHIRAVLRRSSIAPVATLSNRIRVLEFARWRLVIARRQLLSPSGVLTPLRAGEFDLLLALVERPQRVLTRDQLLDIVFGRAAGPLDRSIDVQISRLRRKIEADPKEPELIKTVRNGGYVFAAEVIETGIDA
jgi:two-component system, OmpR family, response regulator